MKWTTRSIVFAGFSQTDALVYNVHDIGSGKKVVNKVLRDESSHFSIAIEI